MGCNNCNENNVGGSNTTKSFPGGISSGLERLQADEYHGHFGLKVVTFIVLLIAIPLVIVVLIMHVFGTFFIPTSLSRIKKKFSGWTRRTIEGWVERKQESAKEKRRKQFFGNTEYSEVDDGYLKDDDGNIYKEVDDSEEENEENPSGIEIHEEEFEDDIEEISEEEFKKMNDEDTSKDEDEDTSKNKDVDEK